MHILGMNILQLNKVEHYSQINLEKQAPEVFFIHAVLHEKLA